MRVACFHILGGGAYSTEELYEMLGQDIFPFPAEEMAAAFRFDRHALWDREMGKSPEKLRQRKRLSSGTGHGGGRREALAKAVKAMLDHGFAFLTDCFGDGQEMILFVSALTRLEQAMDFICRHGCESYLHYSQKLLYREREASLRTACIEYLAEQEP